MVGAAVIVSSTAARPADDRIDGSAVAASRAERRIEPVSAGGPTPALPDIAPGTFVFDPAAWGVPTNGTDRVATTNGFQAAIDHAAGLGLGTFEVPAGTYLIGVERNAEYTGGIELPDRFALVLDDGAVLRQATHDRWNSCGVGVTRSTDVVIRGGTILGDRDTHVFTPRPSDGAVDHDEGHLICIWTGSARVLVDDVRLVDATGDGILLVGQTGPGSFVSDITIRGSEFDRNRRQGISIVGGVRVLIDDNEIHHTGGTAPQFGVNVESLIYRSEEITIRGNHFHHNAGGDVVNTDGRNVLIEDNRFEEGAGNSNLDAPIVFWRLADQTIRRNTIAVRNGGVNGRVGIIGYAGRFEGARPNPTLNWIYENECDGCGFFVYDTAGFRILDNTFRDGFIILRDVDDVLLVGNEVTHPDVCFAYRLRNVHGQAGGNSNGGRPVPLPMIPGVPWTSGWEE